MAKRRTKNQKINAKISYSFPEEIVSKAKSVNRDELGNNVRASASTITYDTRLLTKDLVKTVILSIVILIGELLIYYLI